MSASHVLAIDAGTSGVRCLVADLDGRVVSLSHQEWSYRTDDAIGPLGREFDPDAFWRIICHNVRQALGEAGISAKSVVGVSATSQREGAVFLDGEGKEIYAGPNIDLRALTEGISIDNQFGDEVYSITGHKPSLLLVPARLKWFEANRPETYSRISAVLTISDWIIYRLCGEMVSEVCGAGELGLIDIRTRRWSDRLMQLLALPGGIYHELVPAGRRVGGVTRRAAADTGLAAGTPVAQGGPDAHCGLLGMGVRKRGEVGIVLGWSAPVQMVTDSPVLDPAGRIWACCHPFPEKWLLESSAGEAGGIYGWLGKLMFGQGGQMEDYVYELMDSAASELPPGAEGVLTFAGPAAMNMSHLGMRLGGFLFPLPVSVIGVRPAHLVRAFLENLCFAVKANCLQLESVSGAKIGEVRIGGGLARSRCLMQMLPAVLEAPVCISEMAEVSALGAAICAAVGSGSYRSLEEGMKAMAPCLRTVEPDRLAAIEYGECYQRWTSAAKWLEKLGEETR
ncbi:MAG: hypothetical protein HY530_06555 [Chloroflexi bacterium]|nr:hypothetical protein [Chloroflexota bacterium]